MNSIGVEEEQRVLRVKSAEVLARVVDVVLGWEEEMVRACVVDRAQYRLNHATLFIILKFAPRFDSPRGEAAIGVGDCALGCCSGIHACHGGRCEMARHDLVTRRDITS